MLPQSKSGVVAMLYRDPNVNIFEHFKLLFEGEALEQITLGINGIRDTKGGINPCKFLLSINCIVDAKGGINPCKFLLSVYCILSRC